MKAIYTALAAFQQEVPPIFKGTSGYGYKYAEMSEILGVINPLLKKHKLGFTQLLEGKNLKTVIFHTESSETIESSVEIQQGVSLKGMNEFQVLGSAITYLRRYSLSAALGLVTDSDNDAQGEQHQKSKATPPIKQYPDLEREYAEPDVGQELPDQSLARAKIAINEMLEAQGHDNNVKKKAFILKVLKKSTIDEIADANKVTDALKESIE